MSRSTIIIRDTERNQTDYHVDGVHHQKQIAAVCCIFEFPTNTDHTIVSLKRNG